LGVLAHLAHAYGICGHNSDGNSYINGYHSYGTVDANYSTLSAEIQNWSLIRSSTGTCKDYEIESVSYMNDSDKKSFKEIAAVLKNNKDKYFYPKEVFLQD
jgi:hypothetical protein